MRPQRQTALHRERSRRLHHVAAAQCALHNMRASVEAPGDVIDKRRRNPEFRLRVCSSLVRCGAVCSGHEFTRKRDGIGMARHGSLGHRSSERSGKSPASQTCERPRRIYARHRLARLQRSLVAEDAAVPTQVASEKSAVNFPLLYTHLF